MYGAFLFNHIKLNKMGRGQVKYLSPSTRIQKLSIYLVLLILFNFILSIRNAPYTYRIPYILTCREANMPSPEGSILLEKKAHQASLVH